MGTDPLSFQSGPEEVDKKPCFEGHSESIYLPKGKPGIRDLLLINRGQRSHYQDTRHLQKQILNHQQKSWAVERKVYFSAHF